MDRPSIDFHDPDFVEVYDAAFAGVKRVLQTEQHLFMYNASGHGAWEASLTNLLSPGDTILVLEIRLLLRRMGEHGARAWARGATSPADWRHGVDIAAGEDGARPRTPRTRSRRSASCTTKQRRA